MSGTPPLSTATARHLTRKILAPLERFLRVEATSGIVLLAAAVIALVWANSPAAPLYETIWHAPLTFGSAEFRSTHSVHFWINEGLMTLFFLLAGLEIRRELHDGALSTPQQAALPLVAALGGVIAPALIYVALNSDPALRRGWAVPTATDIAFAVGVLTVLGSRVPSSLRALLLALAIIDDIIAILVIAFFYSSGIDASGFLIAAGGILGVLLFQVIGVRPALAYVLPGAVIWYGLLHAHVHPTLAGVILGLLTPVSSLKGMETALHPWVAFGIMPLFALANAGVSFEGFSLDQSVLPVTLGIVSGLVLGKPLGILLATVITVKLRWITLPADVTWPGMLLIGCLAGVGFTMSIFLATLAFADEALLTASKLAVLAASACAGLMGLAVGRMMFRNRPELRN